MGAKRGRPALDRWPALRAVVASRPPIPRAVAPWTLQTEGPCDRRGQTLAMDCECGGRWWRPMPCTRSDCPLCAPSVGRRRMRRLYERFGGVELGVLVVTFPAQWRRYVQGDAAHELEKHLRGALTRWAAAELGGAIGGRAFWHPTGDVCDACGAEGKRGALVGTCECGARATYKPHLNFVIPGAVLRPDGTVARRHMFLGTGQLASLRAHLGDVLQEAGAVIGPVIVHNGKRTILPTDEEGEPLINFHWQYRAEREKKLHALRYFPRPFPAWAAAMPHTGKDFGLLAGQDEQRQKYRAVIRGEAIEEEAPACPCCGLTLTMSRGSDSMRILRPEWGAATAEAAAAREKGTDPA